MTTTSPRPFVFVLMPFHEAFDDVYKLGIKPACEAAGAYCERVDEQIYEGSIVHRIYNQISKADIIIAEMTGRNPNVFYETGYAHALNKRVILLTQKADDIPFDLKDYPHIIYGGKITKLKEELETKIRWWLEHARDELARVDLDLEAFIDDIPLVDFPMLTVDCIPELSLEYRRQLLDRLSPRGDSLRLFEARWQLEQMGQKALASCQAKITLKLHNPSRRVIRDFTLALVSPRSAFIHLRGAKHSVAGIVMNNGQTLYQLQEVEKVLPDAWHLTSVEFRMSDWQSVADGIDVIIRVFSELGALDFPVHLNFAVLPVEDAQLEGILSTIGTV